MKLTRSARAPILAALVVAAPLSACTSTPTPSAPEASTSTHPSSSPTPTAEGLLGYGVASLDCPTKRPTSTQDRPLQPITGEVEKYVLCPYSLGTRQQLQLGTRQLPGVGYALTPESTVFASLDQALRRPFGPAYGDCPRIPPRVILAQTPDGDWSVHVPTDECGSAQAEVLKVLAQVDRQH